MGYSTYSKDDLLIAFRRDDNNEVIKTKLFWQKIPFFDMYHCDFAGVIQHLTFDENSLVFTFTIQPVKDRYGLTTLKEISLKISNIENIKDFDLVEFNSIQSLLYKMGYNK